MITAEQDAVAAPPPAAAEQIEIDVTGKYRVRVGSGFESPSSAAKSVARLQLPFGRPLKISVAPRP
jgi:hypothetical protein